MDGKTIFNITVCIVGIVFLLIHTVDLVLKRGKRRDEINLLIFIVFTTVHFITYLVFTLIRANHPSDPLIIAFYTILYIMNNVEVLLLFIYTISFVPLKGKYKNTLAIVNLVVFTIFVILDIVNVFAHMFFYSDGGVYMRTRLMFISQMYQYIALAIVFVITVFNSKTKITEKIAFSFYCLLPLVAIILQNIFKGYAIAYLSIVSAIEILFLFVNVKKNIEIADEARKNRDAEIRLMMSQIKPHFVYNTLSSISTLIQIDPTKAQQALDDFTEYLRANLSSLSETKLILFTEELQHIQTYLALEKMRFEERLNLVYDIKVEDFLIPPLSIQPIVENAVKHGILKKIEGGTVTIKTYENKEAYIIEIIDDGVGFDVDTLKTMGNQHIGINNVCYRLSAMCNGEVKVNSIIDKGTTVVVTLYK